MFSIVISEKGGAERRETFDKNEINVGRVQGNDLMLPKGNVSKHHARLLYRDGRFIVTDLKSTNGTYVNGRKIAQATIVREGDKIYIGDFVLKLDTGSGAQVAPAEQDSYRGEDGPSRTPQRLSAPQAPAPVAPPPIAMPAPQLAAHTQQAPTQGHQTQYETEEGAMPKMPAPPRVPAVAAAPHIAAQERVRNSTAVLPNRPSIPQQPHQPSAAPAPQPAPAPPAPQPAPVMQIPSPSAAPPPMVPRIAPAAPRQAPKETPAQAARRLALITLVDRVSDVVELAPLRASPSVDEPLSQQIDRAVREQAKAMRDEGETPDGIDLDALVRDALRELVGLGPVGPLLEEEDVSEIHCLRHDHVIAVRNGQATLAEAAYTSDEALARTIARLAHQSGEPWRHGEVSFERRLHRGAHLVAITPPVATGCVLVIRKRRRVDGGLEDLIRAGSLSRPLAGFLEQCVSGHANIFVAGSGTGAVASVLAALASAFSPAERVAVLHEGEEIGVSQAQSVSLLLADLRGRGEEATRAAARLRTDRLVVGAMSGAVAAATLDAIAEGAEGLLAGVSAPTLRQAIARVAAQVALARPGVSLDAARESLTESFDIALEAVRLVDGRLRILRVSDLGGGDGKGIRDVFTLANESGGDNAFAPSGVVPRVVADLQARGLKVDMNLFKRGR